MRSILLVVLTLALNFFGHSQNTKISGIIIDAQTKKPIDFVNIGILNKNKGTVSNEKGSFDLIISDEYMSDSLTISHINYHSVVLSIGSINNQSILLTPRMNELPEVKLSNKKKKTRKIGVKSYNPLLWLGGISKDVDIIENAQRINIPDKIVRVNYVNIFLRKGFKTDSSFVRINFYKNATEAPGEKIVFINIVQQKEIKPGWLQIDLTDNYVYLEEDFFVGVEFIPDFENPLEVYIGAILTKGKGYSRRNSQGQWNKLQGGSSINVELEY